MLRGMSLLKIARVFLPAGAVFTPVQKYNDFSFIQTGDIDGDELEEIIVGYLWRKRPFVMILKRIRNRWHKIINIRGNAYDINSIALVSTPRRTRKDLIVSWLKDPDVYETNVFTWRLGKLYKIEEETRHDLTEEIISEVSH